MPCSCIPPRHFPRSVFINIIKTVSRNGRFTPTCPCAESDLAHTGATTVPRASISPPPHISYLGLVVSELWRENAVCRHDTCTPPVHVTGYNYLSSGSSGLSGRARIIWKRFVSLGRARPIRFARVVAKSWHICRHIFPVPGNWCVVIQNNTVDLLPLVVWILSLPVVEGSYRKS